MFATRTTLPSGLRVLGETLRYVRSVALGERSLERRIAAAERGFTLAGLIVILTVIMIFAAYTVPRQWSAIMQRERERETVFAMKQYARSIREFAKNHGGTRPVSMDQLKEAKLPRYVRGPKGEIIDPLTGKFDWILVPPGAVTTNPAGGIGQGGPPNGGTTTGTSTSTPPSSPTTFNPAASPKDYIGDFVGVRPPVTGRAMLKFNGAEQYDQWYYTVNDLDAEIRLRTALPNPN
ncbi:MAG TPA: type II secretion system protein [Thermoanaerobaculia bacterium]|jgi:type II secretory pathway pseudopilin PulG